MESARVLKTLHQRPIAYFRIYKDITNSTPAGVVLSQLMYWGEKYDKFWKTDDDIIKETGVTINELRSAKLKIKSLPFVIVTIEGIPATTCYAIDWEGAMQYIDSFLQKLNKFSEIHGTENQTAEKDDLQFSEIHGTCPVKSTRLYTKTTTKTTVKGISNEIQRTPSVDGLNENNLEYNGLLCPICKEKQFRTKSGDTCINGHGGELGIEIVRTSKFLPINLKKIVRTPNPYNYSPQALKIITHWKKCGGRAHTSITANKGVEKIKTFIEELLLNGLNTCYSKLTFDQELKMKQWTVKEIITAIDVYACIKHKPIDKMYFDNFVTLRYNGFTSRKFRDHSPLLDSFENVPNERTARWQNQLRRKLKELYPNVHMNPTVLLNCASFLDEQDKIYKVISGRGSSYGYHIRNVFIAYIRRIVTESGTYEPLKYISGKQNLKDFLSYSINKSFLLVKRTKKEWV